MAGRRPPAVRRGGPRIRLDDGRPGAAPHPAGARRPRARELHVSEAAGAGGDGGVGRRSDCRRRVGEGHRAVHALPDPRSFSARPRGRRARRDGTRNRARARGGGAARLGRGGRRDPAAGHAPRLAAHSRPYVASSSGREGAAGAGAVRGPGADLGGLPGGPSATGRSAGRGAVRVEAAASLPPR